MKRRIVDFLNHFCRLFGFKIVSTAPGEFDMDSMLARIARHGIAIGTVIDIGASNGKWSLKALRTLPGARVLAIEALEEQRDALQRLSGRHPHLSYAICAAGDVDGATCEMAIGDGDLDGAAVGGQGSEMRSVPMRTIDALVAELALPGPYLLKFDTHGFELPIIEGAAQTLAQASVVIMEVYNFEVTDRALRFPEMCRLMESHGLRCFDLVEPMSRPFDGAFWQMDLAFCRADHPIFAHSSYR